MPQPPYYALKFLRWFCSQHRIEEIEGDLIELFEMRHSHSPNLAKWRFVWDVVRSIRLENIKKSNTQIFHLAMLRNHFKVGFRNLKKDLNFTLINVIGMAFGLAVFLLMIMFVHHETNFDHFHTKAHRIYEVVQVFQNADGEDPEIWTSMKLAGALREEMSIVENAVSIHAAASTWVEADGKRFFEEDGIVAEPHFFEIFDFELLIGTAERALTAKRSIVMSESMANKYFGHPDVIGEVINLDSYGDFTVSAVMKDLPTNSYIQFDFIITKDYDVFFTRVAPWFPRWFESWRGDPSATFVLLKNGQDGADFNEALKPILAKNLDPDQINEFYLINLLDLHFGSNGIDGRINHYVKGDLTKIRLLVIVSVIVLVMACFNYINITTARAVNRAKEVGIRKAIGAYRNQLTSQFLVESFVLVACSFLLALGLAFYFLPSVSQITGISIRNFWPSLIGVLPYALLLMLMVTMISGYYPAFHLSRLTSLKALNGGKIGSKNQSLLRNGLVIFQFVMVIVLTSSLLIVNDQYKYMNNKPLGFDMEELIVVEINGGGVRSNYRQIKSELTGHTAIKSVTGLTRMISGYRSPVSIDVSTDEQPDDQRAMRFYGMDSNGPEVLDMEIMYGRSFQGIHALDSTSILLNETAASQFGGDAVVGQVINISDDGSNQRCTVVGIVNDFHYESMHRSIGPIVIGYYINQFESLDDIVIKIDGNRAQEALAHIETVHHRYDENDMMTWEFMDDMVQRAYEDELVFRNLFTAVSILAVLIAVLGVVGLTAFTALAKTKEFGIRKVLGANLYHLLFLQGRKFGYVLLASSVVAIPSVIWMSGQWLDNFAYRASLSPLTFLLVIIGLLSLIAMIVCLVGYRVAKTNPVDALRWE